MLTPGMSLSLEAPTASTRTARPGPQQQPSPRRSAAGRTEPFQRKPCLFLITEFNRRLCAAAPCSGGPGPKPTANPRACVSLGHVRFDCSPAFPKAVVRLPCSSGTGHPLPHEAVAKGSARCLRVARSNQAPISPAEAGPKRQDPTTIRTLEP